MGTVRGVFILASAALLTAILMPVQAILLLIGSKAATSLPVGYHRLLCRILGVRVRCIGRIAPDRPLLLVSNHVSWLDIPVLASLAPLSFIAKQEVRGWPVIGWLARLQRSVFIDRERRSRTAAATDEIAERLRTGDVMVLFAEGTSSDGNRVLPFRSALFGAAHRQFDACGSSGPLAVQPMAIAYLGLNGLPMGRQHRPLIAWHGDLELAPHLWRLVKSGPLDVTVAFGDPLPAAGAADRKALTVQAEERVRAMTTMLLWRGPNAASHFADEPKQAKDSKSDTVAVPSAEHDSHEYRS